MALKRNSSTFSQQTNTREDWCSTELQMKKYCYIWTIQNFSICCKMREVLTSSQFPTSPNGIYGTLHLNLENLNSYTIELKLVKAPNSDIKTDIKFYFLNDAEDKVNAFEGDTYHTFQRGRINGFAYSFSGKDLSKSNLLMGDKLKICCEVNTIHNTRNLDSNTYIAHFDMPACKLNDILANLLNQEQFSDVTLFAEDHEFRVHKFILAARSDVFAAMFEHKMEETYKNRVTITDIGHETLKEMLRFIYTGKVPNLNEMSIDLLAAADKYALGELKVMCEKSLAHFLSIETAAETLILADLYDAKQLKVHTIEFIKKNNGLIQQTRGWQNMIKDHTHLVKENGFN